MAEDMAEESAPEVAAPDAEELGGALEAGEDDEADEEG
jgi:hypothetical protein